MSRRQRLHVPGGTYYIVQHGRPRQPIFSQPEDYALLERLLALTLKRTGARVLAYCWTPHAIHLTLQIDDISVGRFMQGVTSRYARSVHQQAGDSGHFFRQRYKAVLIDPDAYLLKLLHYIHHIPVFAGLAADVGDYTLSSHNAYLGRLVVPWLTTRTALRLIDNCDGAATYATLMSQAPTPQDLDLFRRCGTNDLGVIGSPEFLANLPRHPPTYRTRTSLDQIIHTVTCRLGVEREHVLSSSRQRELALARAVIAWYATERRIATLTEVARRLNRDPSTLSVAVNRYRVCRPELFKLTALHDVVPIGWSAIRSTRGAPQKDWNDEDEDGEILATPDQLKAAGGTTTTRAG